MQVLKTTEHGTDMICLHHMPHPGTAHHFLMQWLSHHVLARACDLGQEQNEKDSTVLAVFDSNSQVKSIASLWQIKIRVLAFAVSGQLATSDFSLAEWLAMADCSFDLWRHQHSEHLWHICRVSQPALCCVARCACFGHFFRFPLSHSRGEICSFVRTSARFTNGLVSTEASASIGGVLTFIDANTVTESHTGHSRQLCVPRHMRFGSCKHFSHLRHHQELAQSQHTTTLQTRNSHSLQLVPRSRYYHSQRSWRISVNTCQSSLQPTCSESVVWAKDKVPIDRDLSLGMPQRTRWFMAPQPNTHLLTVVGACKRRQNCWIVATNIFGTSCWRQTLGPWLNLTAPDITWVLWSTPESTRAHISSTYRETSSCFWIFQLKDHPCCKSFQKTYQMFGWHYCQRWACTQSRWFHCGSRGRRWAAPERLRTWLANQSSRTCFVGCIARVKWLTWDLTCCVWRNGFETVVWRGLAILGRSATTLAIRMYNSPVLWKLDREKNRAFAYELASLRQTSRGTAVSHTWSRIASENWCTIHTRKLLHTSQVKDERCHGYASSIVDEIFVRFSKQLDWHVAINGSVDIQGNRCENQCSSTR